MKILKCDCNREKNSTPAAKYQDAKYGRGYRVHTRGKLLFACTVCGAKRSE